MAVPRRIIAGFFATLGACGARTQLGAPRIDHDDASANTHDASSDSSVTMPSPCTATVPTLLAGGGKAIQFIALDHDSVYFTDYSLGTVNAVAKAGGSAQVLAAGQGKPSGLVVIAGTVYWTEFSGDAVLSAPTSGGTSTTVATNQDGAFEITAAGDVPYWTTLRACSVARAENGGKAHVVAEAHQPFTAIASTNDLVFWVSYQNKSVERFDVASNVTTTLIDGEGFELPTTLATDGTRIYFGGISPSHAAIRSISIDGGDVSTLFEAECSIDGGAPANPCVGNVTTDGAFVYFTADGKVSKVPVDGGEATTIASAQPRPFAIAADDACVYWSNIGDGTVWAAPIK